MSTHAQTHTLLLYFKSPVTTQQLDPLQEILPDLFIVLLFLHLASIFSPSSCPPSLSHLNRQVSICFQGGEISPSPPSIFRRGAYLGENHNTRENGLEAPTLLTTQDGA